MKRTISFIVAGLVLLFQAGGALATTETRTYAVSANLPDAPALTVDQFSFHYDPDTGNPVQGETWGDPGLSLAFGSLEYDPDNHIWGTDVGFAVEVANNGTGGAPQIQFAYADTANPNGAGHGLGYKVVAGFNKLTETDDPLNPDHELIYKKTLRDSNVTITPQQLAGGWLRVYFGVSTGDPDSGVEGDEPFTSNDMPGYYRGTLTVTATVAGGGNGNGSITDLN